MTSRFDSEKLSVFKLRIGFVAVLFFLEIAAPCAASPNDTVILLLTAGYRGRIDGCQCPSGDGGGMARRATLIKRLFHNGTVVGLDAGRFLDLDPEGGLARSRCSLIGLGRLKTAVALVNPRDTFYGLNYIREWMHSAGISPLGGNIVNVDGAAPIFPLWRKIEANGLVIAAAGVVADEVGRKFPTMNDWRIQPLDSLAESLDRPPFEADLTVLLCDLSENDLRALLIKSPHFDIAVTGSRQVFTAAPFNIGRTLVFRPPQNGVTLDGCEVRVPQDGGDVAFTPFSYPINQQIPDDPEFAEWVRDCLNESIPNR